jgi:thiol-disulfide isomerase/thioredoxin
MKRKNLLELLAVASALILVVGGVSFILGRGTNVVTVEAREGYMVYDPADLSDQKSNVLFFKANWCGSCTGLHEDLLENQNKIPQDVQVLEVSYDEDYSTRAYYGVRVQHTLVQVDGQGNELKTWQGSSSLEELLTEII